MIPDLTPLSTPDLTLLHILGPSNVIIEETPCTAPTSPLIVLKVHRTTGELGLSLVTSGS